MQYVGEREEGGRFVELNATKRFDRPALCSFFSIRELDGRGLYCSKHRAACWAERYRLTKSASIRERRQSTRLTTNSGGTDSSAVVHPSTLRTAYIKLIVEQPDSDRAGEVAKMQLYGYKHQLVRFNL